MEIIDLRDYLYTGDNIIDVKKEYFIFYNVERKNMKYQRVFYKYDLINGKIEKINKTKIITSDEACYVHYIKENFLYTTSYVETKNGVYSYVWKINLKTGECNILLEINDNIEFSFLDSQYVIAKGNCFGIDKKHEDEKELAEGKYDYAYLIDLNSNKRYEIKDKKLFWGLNDNIFTCDVEGSRKVFLEEAYMDTWELKDAYDMEIKKEHIYREGYKESINIIGLDELVKLIKNGEENIKFNVISSTNYNGSVRYFGRQDNSIYYRKHNFKNNMLDICEYSLVKNTSNVMKTIDLTDYLYRGLYYSIDEQKIFYEDNFSEKIRVTEILNKSIDIELENEYEEYVNLMEEKYLITNSCEEEDENNMRYYVNIRNLKENKMETFEGFCEFVGSRIILFA